MSGGGGGDNKVKDTPEQRQLAAVAAEKWNFAQQRLAPLEDAYMQAVGEMTAPGKQSYIAGRTMQGQQQQASQLGMQAGQQLQQAGIDPSSGRYQSTMNDVSLGTAQAGGETLGRGLFEQDNEQIKGMQNIVAMGQGQSTQAQLGLSGLANQSAADARNQAAQTFNRRSANLQLLGQVAGAGYGHYSNQTSGMAQPDFTSQIDTGGGIAGY